MPDPRPPAPAARHKGTARRWWGVYPLVATTLLRSGGARRGRRPTRAEVVRGTPAGPVLLVSTQGGHLAQLLALEEWYSAHARVWVCPVTPDVLDRLEGERVVHSWTPTTRSVVNLARNLVLAVQVLRRERPSLVVSAGAGVAVPFFVVAWAMRVPTVFIEVFDRVDSPTMTGRLCGPFSSARLVQWDSQLQFYPDARLIGPML